MAVFSATKLYNTINRILKRAPVLCFVGCCSERTRRTRERERKYVLGILLQSIQHTTRHTNVYSSEGLYTYTNKNIYYMSIEKCIFLKVRGKYCYPHSYMRRFTRPSLGRSGMAERRSSTVQQKVCPSVTSLTSQSTQPKREHTSRHAGFLKLQEPDDGLSITSFIIAMATAVCAEGSWITCR